MQEHAEKKKKKKKCSLGKKTEIHFGANWTSANRKGEECSAHGQNQKLLLPGKEQFTEVQNLQPLLSSVPWTC